MLSRRKFISCIGGSAFVLASPAVARTRLQLGMIRPSSKEQYSCTFGFRGIKKKDYEAFNWLLRDTHAEKSTQIDIDLLEIAARLQTYFKADALTIKSAYRTAKTNAAISGAARRSMHIEGKALDLSITSVATYKMVTTARSLGAGGVGWYPKRGFIHIDTGPIRYWRR